MPPCRKNSRSFGVRAAGLPLDLRAIALIRRFSETRHRHPLETETEMGIIDVEPQEIVVIPRGVRFRVELLDGGHHAGGYAR